MYERNSSKNFLSFTFIVSVTENLSKQLFRKRKFFEIFLDEMCILSIEEYLSQKIE